MQLSNIAKKAELIKIELDTPEIVEKYGEALDFYTWDNIDLNTFGKLSAVTSSNDAVKVLYELILDNEGKKVIQGEMTLPPIVLKAALQAITDRLGK